MEKLFFMLIICYFFVGIGPRQAGFPFESYQTNHKINNEWTFSMKMRVHALENLLDILQCSQSIRCIQIISMFNVFEEIF